jgi:hypothetical protein
MPCGSKRNRGSAGRLPPASDRRNQHHLVAVLKGVGIAAEEADVLVVDVDIDEPAQLAGLILDLGRERGEVLVDVGDQRGQVGRVALELLLAFGVTDERGRKNNLDSDGSAPKGRGRGSGGRAQPAAPGTGLSSFATRRICFSLLGR